jgi:hypothetical protein
MENNLTKEENIILNMLLAKRDLNKGINPTKKKTKKEIEKEKEEQRIANIEYYLSKPKQIRKPN